MSGKEKKEQQPKESRAKEGTKNKAGDLKTVLPETKTIEKFTRQLLQARDFKISKNLFATSSTPKFSQADLIPHENEYPPLIKTSLGNQDVFSNIISFLDKPIIFLCLCKNKEFIQVISLLLYYHFFLDPPTTNNRPDKIKPPKKEKEPLDIIIINAIASSNLRDLKILLNSNTITVDSLLMDLPLVQHAIDVSNENAAIYLIEQGAKTSDIPGLPDNKTILNLALERNLHTLAAHLIMKNYAFDHIPIGFKFEHPEDGPTLLMKMISVGNKILIDKLLTSGRLAEINIGNKDSNPLFSAINYFYLDIVALLLDKGAQVNTKPQDRKYFPLGFFVSEWRLQIPAAKTFANAETMLNLLISHGAKIEELEPDLINQIFDWEEFMLLKTLASFGASLDEIPLENIYLKLNVIVTAAKKAALSWDAIESWGKLLAEKTKNFFSSQTASLEDTSAVWVYDSDEEEAKPITPSLEEDTQKKYIMNTAKVFPAIAAAHKNDWVVIEFFINGLTNAAKIYFPLREKRLYLAESGKPRRRTSSDLTDDKLCVPSDGKSGIDSDKKALPLLSVPPLIPTSDPVSDDEGAPKKRKDGMVPEGAIAFPGSILASGKSPALSNPDKKNILTLPGKLGFLPPAPESPAVPPAPATSSSTTAESAGSSVSINPKDEENVNTCREYGA